MPEIAVPKLNIPQMTSGLEIGHAAQRHGVTAGTFKRMVPCGLPIIFFNALRFVQLANPLEDELPLSMVQPLLCR